MTYFKKRVAPVVDGAGCERHAEHKGEGEGYGLIGAWGGGGAAS